MEAVQLASRIQTPRLSPSMRSSGMQWLRSPIRTTQRIASAALSCSGIEQWRPSLRHGGEPQETRHAAGGECDIDRAARGSGGEPGRSAVDLYYCLRIDSSHFKAPNPR